jgi:lipopolysaccharide transport system permease protein
VLLLLITFYQLTGTHIELSSRMVFVPMILLGMIILALGLGCLIASWTIKYRDLHMLVGYGLQLWMYVSCVAYPASIVPENLRWEIGLNPMAILMPAFRSCLFGTEPLAFSILAALILVLVAVVGLCSFASGERNFTDTI